MKTKNELKMVESKIEMRMDSVMDKPSLENRFMGHILMNIVDLTWTNDLRNDDFVSMIENIDNSGISDEIEVETELSKIELLSLYFETCRLFPRTKKELDEVIKLVNKHEEKFVMTDEFTTKTFLGHKSKYVKWLVDETNLFNW